SVAGTSSVAHPAPSPSPPAADRTLGSPSPNSPLSLAATTAAVSLEPASPAPQVANRAPSQAPPTRATAVPQTPAPPPMSFEINQGQSDPQVQFLARGGGYNLFLSGAEATLVLSQPQGPATSASRPDQLDARLALGTEPA